MNSKLNLIALLLLTFLPTSILQAQATPDQTADKFFKIYKMSPDKGIDYIFNSNKWIADENKEAIDHVKTELNKLVELVGEYYGYEEISTKNVGESYKIISYLIKYDRQPLRFIIEFYKANDQWQVQNFKYDDQITELLE